MLLQHISNVERGAVLQAHEIMLFLLASITGLELHKVLKTATGKDFINYPDLYSEAQVLFTKSMDPVAAEEFGEATLEVEVSLETAEVQWMRQGVVIHPGSKFTLKQCGKKRSLTIHKLALSDRGTYSCETLHDRTQAKLSVERECANADLFLTMCCC